MEFKGDLFWGRFSLVKYGKLIRARVDQYKSII